MPVRCITEFRIMIPLLCYMVDIEIIIERVCVCTVVLCTALRGIMARSEAMISDHPGNMFSIFRTQTDLTHLQTPPR